MKEFIRKKIVALKRNPSIIPMLALVISFLFFSLNLTSMSNTTAKIQASGMGLSQFCIMLFSMLSMVCMMNSFPRRKKPNIPMIVLLFLMVGIIIFCDYHYIASVRNAISGENSTLSITDNTRYIQNAMDMLNVHAILEIISAALVALLPVYSKMIRKINTSVTVEGNDGIGEIEISE